jgi:hypothetical protein
MASIRRWRASTIKIVVRLNNVCPWLLGVALAAVFAYHHQIRRQDTEAWKLLLLKKENKLRASCCIEKLHRNCASFSYIDLSGTNLREFRWICDFSNATSGADLQVPLAYNLNANFLVRPSRLI